MACFSLSHEVNITSTSDWYPLTNSISMYECSLVSGDSPDTENRLKNKTKIVSALAGMPTNHKRQILNKYTKLCYIVTNCSSKIKVKQKEMIWKTSLK